MSPITSSIDSLNKLIETLRGKKGCPWDKKQTPATMVNYLVQEVYELGDAIASGIPDKICEELGDVLFHVLFIARLFKEMNHFGIDDAAKNNTQKMIRRHPHVFGDAKFGSVEEAKLSWNKIKLQEKNQAGKDSIFDSISAGLPPLLRAYRISERAVASGFDWDDISSGMKKAEEKWAELKSELAGKNNDHQDVKFGDFLFTLINLACFVNIHPETALTGSIKKFEKRFKYMEKEILEQGKNLESASQKEIDILWEKNRKIKWGNK